MNRVHIANTDFEFELAHPSNGSLEKGWKGQPICLQLQYLPLLYGDPEDIIAVTQIPDNSFFEQLEGQPWRKGEKLPQMVLVEEIEPYINCECLSWGYSEHVMTWARHRNMLYNMADWSVVREVNSKAFSHRYTVLKEAKQLWNDLELDAWSKSFSGKKVLKTCFGLSGKGLRIFDDATPLDELVKFCEKEWKAQRPMIAEPWLERVFDFSTQWEISKAEIRLVGATVFETTPYGVYNATIVGSEKVIFGNHIGFLEEHKQASIIVLQDMVEKGFFGNVGIDALLYRPAGKENIYLYPIVEVNARKTMSWVALKMQQKYFPDKTGRFEFLHYTSKGFSLLPLSLEGMKPFKHSLFLSIK